MTLLLIAGTIFAALALILLAAFFITGGKNQKLRYLASASVIIMALLWLIRTFMR